MKSKHNPTDMSDEELADHLVASLPGGVFSSRSQWLDFLAAEEDGPIIMLNIATVGDADAYGRYVESATPAATDVGIRIVASGRPLLPMSPDAEPWDSFDLVEYPNRAAFVSMFLDERYQAAAPHRDAGLSAQLLWACIPD
ncbi:MAG: DUF1330 domain-containing protein [Acidimicrobiales bacterium]